MMLSAPDLMIIALMSVSGLISIFRGFVREVLSITNWLLAIFITWHYGSVIAPYLASIIHSKSLLYPIAYVSTFVTMMLLGGLLTHLLCQLMRHSGLSGTDRTLGFAFGLVRGVVVIGVLLLITERFTAEDTREEWIKHSMLIPLFLPVEEWLSHFLPDNAEPQFIMQNTP